MLTRSVFELSRSVLRGFYWVPIVALVAGCSGGGDDTSSSPPLPNMEQAQHSSQERYATTAQSMPQPAATATPTLRVVPPAPVDGPVPRLPLTAATPLALADGLGPKFLVPSILRRTIVAGLVGPTDLVFANDGTLFVTERDKGLYAMRPGSMAAPVFEPKDLIGGKQAGMLAVALDPEFARNRYAYVLMFTKVGGTQEVRVVRVTMNAGSTQASDRKDILIAPIASGAEQSADAQFRLSGTLRFGPGGMLYVGLGEGRSKPFTQAGNSLSGKLLRIDREGRAAAGNNPLAGLDKRIYAVGLTEPSALTFHPNTETAIVGQRHVGQPDDLSMVVPRAAIVQAWRGGRPGEGLSAIERLKDPAWGEWRNSFVVAFDKAQRLDLVKLSSDGRTLQSTPALEKLGFGFSAVAQGPDGLYVATSGKAGGEEVWRLSIQ